MGGFLFIQINILCYHITLNRPLVIWVELGNVHENVPLALVEVALLTSKVPVLAYSVLKMILTCVEPVPTWYLLVDV